MTSQDNRSIELSLAQLAALDRVMAIAEFTPDGTLLRVNPHYLSLMGYTAQEILGRHHSFFCPRPLAESPAYATFWPRLHAGNAHSGIVERIRRDGSSCWLEATYTPVFDGDGQVVQVLKVATDITARLAKERVQQERLRMLSLVADASDTAVMISDSQRRIAYTNAGFGRMFGWRDDEIRGMSPMALLVPDKDEQTIAEYYAEMYAAGAMQREEIVVGKQGQRYWAKVVSNPIFDSGGHLQHTVTLFTDITQAKMHEALQHRVLESMAREQPLTEVLELICMEVERIAPELAASILSVDEEGRLHSLAAPSLPSEYSRQLNGVSIGPTVGSCGTAAWRNEAVLVDDIASDPLWANYQNLASSLGFRSCWSTPIRNSQGDPIGTFAFYFRQPRNVASALFHQRLVDACAHLCSLDRKSVV